MVRLAGPRRPYKEQAAVPGDETNGGQVEDEGLGYVRVEGPVEGVQRLHLRDASPLEAACQEAVAATGQLILHQELEEVPSKALEALGQDPRLQLANLPLLSCRIAKGM